MSRSEPEFMLISTTSGAESMDIGSAGVFPLLPRGDNVGLDEGNQVDGIPGSLTPVLRRVETDLENAMLLALRSWGVDPLLGDGNELPTVADARGASDSKSCSCNKFSDSITPFMGVGATDPKFAGSGVRVRRGRRAPGRLLPLPVCGADPGPESGKKKLFLFPSELSHLDAEWESSAK